MIINYYQWSSMIISYYQLLWVIKDHELSYNYNLFSSIIINYHQLSYYHQLLSMIINDHQLLSIIINYHQLSSIIINDHQLSSIIINDHQVLSMIINDHQLLSIVISHQWSWIIIQLSFILINYYQLSQWSYPASAKTASKINSMSSNQEFSGFRQG